MSSTNSDYLNQVVVGVGGSERSFAALRYAFSLSHGSENPVTAVIVDAVRLSLAMSFAQGQTLQHLITQAERLSSIESDRIAERALRLADDLDRPLTILRQEGSVVDALTDASEQASLLVVGKRGHRDDHGGFLGTNTELLSRRVRIPILLTPSKFEPIREVVVAYAAKEAGVRNLALARALCNDLEAELRVVSVAKSMTRAEEIIAQAREALGEKQSAAEYNTLSGDVADELCRVSGSNRLLLLGASGRSRTYRFLLGDVTVEAMRRARGPVLISAKPG